MFTGKGSVFNQARTTLEENGWKVYPDPADGWPKARNLETGFRFRLVECTSGTHGESSEWGTAPENTDRANAEKAGIK